MTADALFSLANLVALAGWVVLVAAPRWRTGAALVSGLLVPALLAALYAVLAATRLGGADGGFGSLDQVAALFADEWVLLAGWVHYLAFDLFVGSWEARDARRNGVPHLLLVPCLAVTFLLGPAGFLLYLGVRAARQRRIAPIPEPA
jgi:hypothetical protein